MWKLTRREKSQNKETKISGRNLTPKKNNHYYNIRKGIEDRNIVDTEKQG